MMRLVVFALLFFSSVSYAASDNTTVTKITDNVYSIYSDYYTSLVVVGDKGVLITDPANAYRAATLQKAVAEITDLPVTHIVLSHEHYDHVGGTELFEGATVVAQENAPAVFALDVTGEAPKTVDETFDRSYSIQMGKTQVNLLHFGVPSDGVANTVVYLPNEQLVYTADFYEDNELVSKDFIDAFNSLGARKTLNTVVALNPKYAVASHSATADVDDLHMAAEFYNDLHDAILPKLMEARAQGYAAQTEFVQTFPKQLKMEKFKDWKNYDHLYRHAERMIESMLHGG